MNGKKGQRRESESREFVTTHTRNGFRVWTETYDRELDSAFALQDEIARSVVDALKIKLGVRVSAHEQPVRASAPEQPVNSAYDLYLQRFFTDLTHPTEISSIGISVPLRNPSNSFTVPDYTSPGSFEPRRLDTRVTAAPPGTGFTTSVRDRASEAGPRTNKITPDGPASIQGFVKDANGEPIKGTDLRIESRDGKQVFSTVKTDSKGRYISQGLQPGVYRVTLLVNGAVKASIMNTQTKTKQPTQLNFDFKSQADSIARAESIWFGCQVVPGVISAVIGSKSTRSQMSIPVPTFRHTAFVVGNLKTATTSRPPISNVIKKRC